MNLKCTYFHRLHVIRMVRLASYHKLRHLSVPYFTIHFVWFRTIGFHYIFSLTKGCIRSVLSLLSNCSKPIRRKSTKKVKKLWYHRKIYRPNVKNRIDIDRKALRWKFWSISELDSIWKLFFYANFFLCSYRILLLSFLSC